MEKWNRYKGLGKHQVQCTTCPNIFEWIRKSVYGFSPLFCPDCRTKRMKEQQAKFVAQYGKYTWRKS